MRHWQQITAIRSCAVRHHILLADTTAWVSIKFFFAFTVLTIRHFPQAFATRCIDAEVVRLTKRQRDLIVQAHNKVRNRVAGGTSALQPACRMATMQWDDELAALAELNVKQCEGSHDCHNTDTFKYSGQNLAWITYNDSPNTTEMSLKSVHMWSGEIENTKMEHINKYPNNYQGP